MWDGSWMLVGGGGEEDGRWKVVGNCRLWLRILCYRISGNSFEGCGKLEREKGWGGKLGAWNEYRETWVCLQPRCWVEISIGEEGDVCFKRDGEVSGTMRQRKEGRGKGSKGHSFMLYPSLISLPSHQDRASNKTKPTLLHPTTNQAQLT